MSLKVYYLDDEIELCEIFEEYFSKDNILIETFNNVTQAMEACQDRKPDIFFIDFRLPESRGDEVAEQLHEDIIKILVTGDLDYNSDFHFTKIISKPFDIEEIESILNSYL